MSTVWTAYDRPELLHRVSRSDRDGRRQILLQVDGLRCAACVRRLEKALPDAECHTDLAAGLCELNWDPGRTRLSALLSQIESAGFAPRVLGSADERAESEQTARHAELRRIGVALLFGMQVMMLASAEYFGEIHPDYEALLRYAQWFLATPVALYAGWPFIAQGFRALVARSPTMDTPVGLAISCAYAASAWHTVSGHGAVYFDSVAMFVLLLSLARMAERNGRVRAADRTRRLAATMPLVAVRETGQGSESVAADQLQTDDVVLVGPGSVIPADGQLLSAQADLDESILSGESEPRRRCAGDAVLAGSTNLSAEVLRVQVRRSGADTRLAGIARLAEAAMRDRPQLQIWADRIAGHFVAVVLVAASLGFVWHWWQGGPALATALAVLVVTCPCALSLATPTSFAAATTALAKHGVLLVRGQALVQLQHLDVACLDKTGTLTTSAMRLNGVTPLAELDATQCLALAAALEAGIAHPVARAFADIDTHWQASERGSTPARGVRGRIQGQDYTLEPRAETAHAGGARPFELCRDGQALCLFELSESLRPGAREAIAALQAAGLRVELLSGDQPGPVAAIAAELGIDRAQSGLLPEDKLDRLKALRGQGHAVLAIGDGVNDAPLLAAADVSIGLAGGTALAQSHGDAILMEHELKGLAPLIEIAAATRRIVKQNLIWALAYNATMLPLAMAGFITPWIAALGMGASSLLVTANALRLVGAGRRAPAADPVTAQPQVAA